MGKDYIKKSLSHYLFLRPSFSEGMARVFDFAGSVHLYPYSMNASEADAKAITSDWEIVGKDIQQAIDIYARNTKSSG